MFTGIVQGVARVDAVEDRPGLRTLRLVLPAGVGRGLEVGASVSVDGVCLTATALLALAPGATVNVERAARADAEVGGHPLSGHVDVQGRVAEVRTPQNNRVLRVALPAPWMRYLFAKGYVAVDGASLTVAEARRERDGSGWFEVWLIPETLRQTTFGAKAVGDALNIEIERATQVVVDTVRDALDERLGALLPALRALLAERGVDLDALAAPPPR
jgi:riboflavin synthase